MTAVVPYMEKLARFAYSRFPDEMAQVREEYVQKLGIGHESDDSFEEAMKAYLDEFLFEHRIAPEWKTPLEIFVNFNEAQGAPVEADIYRGFLGTERSLYLIRKIRGYLIDCRDLFTGERLTVYDETPSGFLEGEIFETRILVFEGTKYFGDVFRFHPPRVGKLLTKAARTLRKSDATAKKEFLFRLAACKTRRQRFPRIDPLEFYKEIIR